jgi:transposase
MKIDGRSFSHETSEKIRKLAVQRVKDGERPSHVMKSLGLCRTTIYKWLNAEKRGGTEALLASKHSGPEQKLSPAQRLRVRKWISGKDPRQYGFDFGLWTRQIVAELIEEKFDIKVSLTTVGKILADLDITSQKPLRRAYERDPAAIRRWTRRVFPMLRKRAQLAGAKIFFLDEVGVRSDDALGRTWGIRGKTPEVPTSGRRQSVNAISAVNAQGEFWYEIYTERLNASKFVELLKNFMRRRKFIIFLVLDGHPAHTAKLVERYVKNLKGQLELHFLPGYAPELNPDEFVWHYLKQEGVRKIPLRKNESLKERVNCDLASIKSKPKLVRSFFDAPSVAYTAD